MQISHKILIMLSCKFVILIYIQKNIIVILGDYPFRYRVVLTLETIPVPRYTKKNVITSPRQQQPTQRSTLFLALWSFKNSVVWSWRKRNEAVTMINITKDPINCSIKTCENKLSTRRHTLQSETYLCRIISISLFVALSLLWSLSTVSLMKMAAPFLVHQQNS